MKQILLSACAVSLFASSGAMCAEAADAAATPRAAEIEFANHGGIDDWKADGRDAILIRSRDRHYYRATFMASCENLPFAEQVGFVTDARDVLDKFDSIEVRGESCHFSTFTEIPRPGKW